jgi:hyperosmotically inducible protein
MQVRLALSLNRDLKGSNIKVDVNRREVTLSGEAETRAQGDRALEIARDTGSVTSVIDRIHLRGLSDAGAPREPLHAAASAESAAAAQRAVRSNSSLAGFDLQVQEEGGRLVLRGQLGTHAEKDLAGLLAREAAGEPVENLVEVRSGTQ